MLTRAWNAIPAPIRTVINVALAAALLVVVGDVVDAQGVTAVDWSQSGTDALNALGLGVATAILRALNPLDHGYGTRSGEGEDH